MKKDEWKKLVGEFNLIASKQEQDQLIECFRAAGYELSDIYQELEMKAYYVDTHRDVTFAGGEIHLHTHDFYEFICVQNVGCVEYMIGTECVSIQKGDVLVLPPGVPHCPLIPKDMDVPYERDVLWVSRALVPVVFRQMERPFPITGKWVHLRTAGTRYAYLPQLFRRGVQEAEECRQEWEAYVLGNTLVIMAELRRCGADQSPGFRRAKELRLLEKAISYIDSHYREKITLAEIANHCFVSESTISHAFQQKMGTSFSRYLTKRRLIASKELIRSDMPLEQISKIVGFTDYSAFYRAFKRENSISPRQYKELLLRQSAEEGRTELC